MTLSNASENQTSPGIAKNETLAITAAQCATTVIASCASELMTSQRQSFDQIIKDYEELMKKTYAFLSDPKSS